MEVIHHPDHDQTVFMPYAPAIKIKSGKILWLSGNTALPVYHDHPHRREDVLTYMPNDLEAQTRMAMDGIQQTLAAAHATFADVVHIFIFRARPRMGDIGKATPSSTSTSRPTIIGPPRPTWPSSSSASRSSSSRSRCSPSWIETRRGGGHGA